MDIKKPKKNKKTKEKNKTKKIKKNKKPNKVLLCVGIAIFIFILVDYLSDGYYSWWIASAIVEFFDNLFNLF